MLGLVGEPVRNIDDKPMASATSGKDAEPPQLLEFIKLSEYSSAW